MELGEKGSGKKHAPWQQTENLYSKALIRLRSILNLKSDFAKQCVLSQILLCRAQGDRLTNI